MGWSRNFGGGKQLHLFYRVRNRLQLRLQTGVSEVRLAVSRAFIRARSFARNRRARLNHACLGKHCLGLHHAIWQRIIDNMAERTKQPASASKAYGRLQTLGLKAADFAGLAKAIRTGLSFDSLIRFHKATQLPWPAIATQLEIPPRTLARRKALGKLSSHESERLLRLARLFELALGLFEGNVAGALTWLQTESKALGGQVPLEVARTEIGARAVEDLIGRLEYGVYS